MFRLLFAIILFASVFSTSRADILVCPSQSVSVSFFVNVTLEPFEPVDIIILWGTNYGATKYSYNYYMSQGSRYLKTSLDTLAAANPDVRFSLATFTTKNIIGWQKDHVVRVRRTLTSDTQSIIDALTPIIFDSNNPYVTDVEAVYQSSLLEAMIYVAQNENSIGLRPNSRRIFLTVTNLMYGVSGDVVPYMNSPNSNFPFAFDLDPMNTIPQNNLNGILESDCTINGKVCLEIYGLQRMLDGNIECNGALVDGFVNALNVTQFGAGSCEDYPTLSNLSSVLDDEYTLFVVIEYDPTKRDDVDPTLVAAYTSLLDYMHDDSLIFPLTYNLTQLLPVFVPRVHVLPNVSCTASPIVDSYYYGACNDMTNLCAVVVNFVYDYDGGLDHENITCTVVGHQSVSYNVSICAIPTGSESQEQSQSQTITESQSHHTRSQSVAASHHQTTSKHSGVPVFAYVLIAGAAVGLLVAICAVGPSRSQQYHGNKRYQQINKRY